MNPVFSIFLFYFALSSTGAVLQQIEIYSEESQGGDVIILRNKIEDLANWQFFLKNAKSYCAVGIWHFFESTNYEGPHYSILGNGSALNAWEDKRCEDYSDFGIYNSARFRGPSDTRVPGLSIIEGTDMSIGGGIELLLEGGRRAMTNFPFHQFRQVSTSGGSSWTFYNEENFLGDSWTLNSDGNLYSYAFLNVTTQVIRSVIRNCD